MVDGMIDYWVYRIGEYSSAIFSGPVLGRVEGVDVDPTRRIGANPPAH
jgi:hypothetical protein